MAFINCRLRRTLEPVPSDFGQEMEYALERPAINQRVYTGTGNNSHLHSHQSALRIGLIFMPVDLIVMFLGCERKPKYLKETHTRIGFIWYLNTFLFWYLTIFLALAEYFWHIICKYNLSLDLSWLQDWIVGALCLPDHLLNSYIWILIRCPSAPRALSRMIMDPMEVQKVYKPSEYPWSAFRCFVSFCLWWRWPEPAEAKKSPSPGLRHLLSSLKPVPSCLFIYWFPLKIFCIFVQRRIE